jgi:hypothetical protein
MESVTIATKKHPDPKYNFGEYFYKMPSYLRRSAIQEAIGAYSSYRSNLANWKNGDRKGRQPKMAKNYHVMPTLYKNNMYVRTGRSTAEIKILHKNDWVWLSVELNRQDVKYIVKLIYKTINLY